MAAAILMMDKSISETEKINNVIDSMTKGRCEVKKKKTTHKDSRRRYRKTKFASEVSTDPAAFTDASSLLRSELLKFTGSSGDEVWTDSFPHGRWEGNTSHVVSPRQVGNQSGKRYGKQARKRSGIPVWSADRAASVKYNDDKNFVNQPNDEDSFPME